MGIFGIAKKGFGLLGKTQATQRMLRGTSTRADRIKHGGRSPDIKSIPMSKTARKDISKSVTKGKDHFYIKNIDEVTKHKENISKGKESIKKLKHMKDTKRAFRIGKTSIHPSNPSKGSKEWGNK